AARPVRPSEPPARSTTTAADLTRLTNVIILPLVLPARSSRPVRAERRGTGGGHPVRGSCAVRYPCLPVTPADRRAGGVTAPGRLTRVVNGGWLPRGRRSEQHTGTTSTTTDRNGELFIPGPARLISQSPPEI